MLLDATNLLSVGKLFRQDNGSTEGFDLELPTSTFREFRLSKPVQVEGHLMRLEDGILLQIDELTTEVTPQCVRCEKKLKFPLSTEGAEWMFYEDETDEERIGDAYRIQGDRLEIDITDALRQEIILANPENPHCDKDCMNFADSSDVEENKPFANLKEMLQDAPD